MGVDIRLFCSTEYKVESLKVEMEESKQELTLSKALGGRAEAEAVKGCQGLRARSAVPGSDLL